MFTIILIPTEKKYRLWFFWVFASRVPRMTSRVEIASVKRRTDTSRRRVVRRDGVIIRVGIAHLVPAPSFERRARVGARPTSACDYPLLCLILGSLDLCRLLPGR